MRKIRQYAALILAGLALGGCVKLGGKAPPQLLNLTATAQIAANDARTATSGQALTIAVPAVPQAIANTRLAVNNGPVIIAYVKDAVWVEPPARLFQRLLSETVAAKTGKVVLDPRQFSMDSGIQLSGHLKSFGIDAQAGRAVIVYDATLTRDRGKKVETRRFEASEPIGVVEAVAAGAALNRAANRMAADVAAWVG